MEMDNHTSGGNIINNKARKLIVLKKISITIVLLYTIAILIACASNTNNAEFGQFLPDSISLEMTKDAVLNVYKKNDISQYGEIDNTVIFSDVQYLGYSVNQVYAFDDNKRLINFTSIFEDPSDTLYEELRTIIIDELGDISKDKSDELVNQLVWEKDTGTLTLLYIKQSFISSDEQISIAITK